jgi:hypothetical protein
MGTTFSRGRIVCLAVAIVIAFVLAALTGEWAARPNEYDWGVAATVSTAVGTTLLALGTFWLAMVSASELRTTARLLDIQEEDRERKKRDEERRDSAWLRLADPIAFFPNEDGSGAACDVLVVNAGEAAAFDIRVRFEIYGSQEPGSGRTLIALETFGVLLPGADRRVSLRADPAGGARFTNGVNWPNLGLMVEYRDRRQPGRTDWIEDPPVFGVAKGKVGEAGAIVALDVPTRMGFTPLST